MDVPTVSGGKGGSRPPGAAAGGEEAGKLSQSRGHLSWVSEAEEAFLSRKGVWGLPTERSVCAKAWRSGPSTACSESGQTGHGQGLGPGDGWGRGTAGAGKARGACRGSLAVL